MQEQKQYTPVKEPLTAVPLGDFNVMEDETALVNQLYYAVPRFENGRFQCSFFYEENTFHKESNGDLTLMHSEYGAENLPEFYLPTDG